MSWVRLDDQDDQRREVEALSDAAYRLRGAALLWSARALADGFIPDKLALRLTATASAKAVRELTEGGLWRRVPGGYQIVDYLDTQPSREQVERRRAERHESAMKAGQARAGLAQRERGRFTSTATSVDAGADAGTDAGTDAGHHGTSPVPVPVFIEKTSSSSRAPAHEAGATGHRVEAAPVAPASPETVGKILPRLAYQEGSPELAAGMALLGNAEGTNGAAGDPRPVEPWLVAPPQAEVTRRRGRGELCPESGGRPAGVVCWRDLGHLGEHAGGGFGKVAGVHSWPNVGPASARPTSETIDAEATT